MGRLLHRLTRGITPAIMLSISLAFASFVYTALDYSRKERLESVRAQIGKLYGPLSAMTKTSEALWNDIGRDRKLAEADLGGANDPKIVLWRRFLSKVVMPLDDQIEDTLLKSGQVIRCEEVSDKLHKFFSFAASIKLAVSAWKSEDVIEDRTKSGNGIDDKISYPRELSVTLANNLGQLKKWEKALDNPLYGLIYFPNLDEPCKKELPPAQAISSRHLSFSSSYRWESATLLPY
jgi:hypothetical protein